MADSIEVANTATPLFEIEILREGQRLAPRSLEELEQWLQLERQFWKWLNEAKGEDPSVESLLNFVLHQDRGIIKTINALKTLTSEEQRTGLIEGLRNLLTDRYVTQQAPTAGAPISKYANELAKKDKVVAAHALWALLGKDPLPSNRPGRAFRGMALGVLYDHDPNTPLQAHEAAWKELRARISSEHEALRREAGELSDRYRKVSQDIHSLHASQRSGFDEMQAARATDFKKLVEEHVSTMDNIQATFKRELSLRAAVEYLAEKADKHQKTAKTAGIAAGIAGCALVGLAIGIGLLVFKEGQDVPVPQIAVAVLTATLAFWLLRILVRVLLSNLHLETDMRARSTFVHTYLALLAEGGGIKDEDRALVIGLVFRPISDGLVRDDATPPGLWDLITKNLSGRN
jgi:hypothetical protein